LGVTRKPKAPSDIATKYRIPMQTSVEATPAVTPFPKTAINFTAIGAPIIAPPP
jgi:hypothetical protein